MSAPFIFDSMTEHKHSMTVFMRTQDGVLTSATFGDIDSDKEYRLVCVGQSGRRYKGGPDHEVSFMLFKHGEPSQRILFYPDEPDSGFQVSHLLRVTAPHERASSLAHAATLFMQGTKYALEHLYRVPKLKAISYEDDAFIISYDLYDTLKLGLTTEHRRLLISYEREFREIDFGLTRMTFRFVDEEENELSQAFLVPTEHVADIAADLSAFLFKHRQIVPKVIAAPVSSLWLAAA